MKNKYLLASLILSLSSILCIVGCSNNVINDEYNDYYKKVSKIINDFNATSNVTNNKKKSSLKKIDEKNDEILAIIDKADGKKQKPDFANAFEQSFYVPIIMGKGLTEYRKQTSFYDVVAFVDEQYYIKTFLDSGSISTYVYIPSECSYDGVGHYIYFGVNYIDDNNYTFGGVEVSDNNNEWYFYGDSSLLFVEYSKNSEGSVIDYQSPHTSEKEINDQNVISEVRSKLDNSFSLINLDTLKNLKNESKFEISKKEYSKIMDELFPDRGGVSTVKGFNINNGVALGYVSDGEETKITLPNNVTSISNNFYIFARGNIKELYIPKSITKITDQEGNDVDIRTFNIEYFNGDSRYYLDNIIVEEGSTLFKIKDNLLVDVNDNICLYLMHKKTENIDLLKYYQYSDWFFQNQLIDILSNVKTLKYNLVYDENNDLYDIFVSQFTNEELDLSVHFDYLEVGNVYNEYNFPIYNDKVVIEKLVLSGSFDKIYISDEFGVIKNIELNSTNQNATFAGIANGIETINILSNNLETTDFINCLNIKTIIVHEGVTEFSLDKFEIDYTINRLINIYLPSTLNKIECNRIQENMATKLKFISKTNKAIFTDFSNIKRYGCEIEIEDNIELNNIINDYEYAGYFYDIEKDKIDDSAIRLINYCGNNEELYVPSSINGIQVKDFTISSRSSINSEPMKNTKTLKKLHLTNTLTSFSVKQDYFINGNDYSDERNYHLDTIYYDGTLEEFQNKFDMAYSLLERKFCKEIIFTDQTLKVEEEPSKDLKNFSDLTIDIEGYGQLTFTNVYIEYKNETFHVNFKIQENEYDVELCDNVKYYNGITNYDQIEKIEFIYDAKKETLKVDFRFFENEYIRFFETN